MEGSTPAFTATKTSTGPYSNCYDRTRSELRLPPETLESLSTPFRI